MKKVFLDANVIIDLLAERKKWLFPILEILEYAKSENISLYCSIISLPTVDYIMERQEKISHDIVIQKVDFFISLCEPILADKQIAKSALKSSFKDFEDAMQYFSAVSEGCDVIITRNKKDFLESKIQVLEPQEFLDEFL